MTIAQTLFRSQTTSTRWGSRCESNKSLIFLTFQVVWCNNTTEKILGYGRDDMIGKDIREFQTTGSGDNITSKVGQNFEGVTNCFDCSEW